MFGTDGFLVLKRGVFGGELRFFGVELKVVLNWGVFDVKLRVYWAEKEWPLFVELMCWTLILFCEKLGPEKSRISIFYWNFMPTSKKSKKVQRSLLGLKLWTFLSRYYTKRTQVKIFTQYLNRNLSFRLPPRGWIFKEKKFKFTFLN